MTSGPNQANDVRLLSLPQLAPLGRWQLELPHDRADHLLLWVTRGQGVALFDGARAGIGTHNAIFVPARQLLAIDLGRQCFGQALVLPVGSAPSLPDRPVHLRVRDVTTQNELAGLLDAITREQDNGKSLNSKAVLAYCELAAIWLQRVIETEPAPTRASAARRLARRYFDRLVHAHATGASMADHAAALGVTPTHLTRVCKSQTGRTAAALLTGRVLHEARAALVQSNRPASHIAKDLGFSSAAYFTRFMQHHTGLAPSAIRRSAA
ncbi:helix-turn-helix domain-containing protein [Ruegeria sp. 2012CJ41-6]|uniref:Helix-turn-helix domain-containing protein n=1 Tax=Ruegeria spongiae TaxID=2942209 RepID=A0ABT0Q6L8_9RHOB|nr:AraC family transcriptional regulator [Ruegeria spongiae]MCL6285531.1 helix-turn-helix domain-containing protein [Ruegeria spongiae]